MTATVTESEWTPGPWRVIDNTDVLALEGTPSSIVVASTKFFEGPSTSWERANARLIAAAPELLAAARRLWDRYEPAAESIGKYDPDMETLGSAIAKAEGHKP